MDIFFHDPNEIRLPPEEVRLCEVRATPEPNGRRVKIYLELTPFMKRPNIEVTISTAAGKTVAHTSILETMQRKLEFTMHLREPEPNSEYIIECLVYYQKLPEPSEVPKDIPFPDPMVVDRHKVMFILQKLDTSK
jgi:hypothetical protein